MKFLIPLLLLTGCMTDHAVTYPVELPGDIAGTYVQCGSELECVHDCVGVCPRGYWIAEEITSLQFPHEKIGQVIVCGKSPNHQ